MNWFHSVAEFIIFPLMHYVPVRSMKCCHMMNVFQLKLNFIDSFFRRLLLLEQTSINWLFSFRCRQTRNVAVLYWTRGCSPVHQFIAVSVNGTTTDLWTVETRRCQIVHGKVNQNVSSFTSFWVIWITLSGRPRTNGIQKLTPTLLHSSHLCLIELH